MNSVIGNILEKHGSITLPGVYDAFSARCVELSGFDCAYLGSGNLSASLLGYPDVGLLTFTELESALRRIRRVANIPLIVDLDSGHGDAFALGEYLERIVDAGAEGIQIEDQQGRKRCGHAGDTTVAPRSEVCHKIAIAREVVGDDIIVIARTDARDSEGLSSAIDRASAYASAGADWLFIEAPASIEELNAIGSAGLGRPLVANMVVGGRTPVLDASTLRELGFDVALYAGAALQAAGHAVLKTVQTLAQGGLPPLEEMLSLEKRFEILRQQQYFQRQTQRGIPYA